MSQFKFPIGAKIARSLTDAPLLIVGREESFHTGTFKKIYWVIDTSGVHDWQFADVMEDEFMEIES